MDGCLAMVGEKIDNIEKCSGLGYGQNRIMETGK
jgi:hypothetical protein